MTDDFELKCGPDDKWAGKRIKPTPCREERDCEWMPWCRLEKRCKRLLADPMIDAAMRRLSK